jgi:hypothetical protein
MKLIGRQRVDFAQRPANALDQRATPHCHSCFPQ